MPKYSNTSDERVFTVTAYQRKSNLFFDFSLSPCCGSVTYTPLCFMSQDACICAQVAKKRHQNVFLSFGKESVTVMVWSLFSVQSTGHQLIAQEHQLVALQLLDAVPEHWPMLKLIISVSIIQKLTPIIAEASFFYLFSNIESIPVLTDLYLCQGHSHLTTFCYIFFLFLLCQDVSSWQMSETRSTKEVCLCFCPNDWISRLRLDDLRGVSQDIEDHQTLHSCVHDFSLRILQKENIWFELMIRIMCVMLQCNKCNCGHGHCDTKQMCLFWLMN